MSTNKLQIKPGLFVYQAEGISKVEFELFWQKMCGICERAATLRSELDKGSKTIYGCVTRDRIERISKEVELWELMRLVSASAECGLLKTE